MPIHAIPSVDSSACRDAYASTRGVHVRANTRIHVQSKRNAAKGCATMLADAVMIYRQELGGWPSDLTSLHSDIGRNGEPILMRPPPRDPWGRDFRYKQLASGDADFRIWSVGPDGIDGTADDIEVREARASP
jgi:hypothetical protein